MMVDFSDFSEYILKQFVIEEKIMDDGHSLFLIKKKRKSYFWKHRYHTKNIPHRYQQNNTLEEAQESIKVYLVQELGIHPVHQHHRKSFWRKFFRSISR